MSTPALERLPSALSGHAGYLLVRLGKHAQRSFSAEIEPLGLRPPHADILFTLGEGGAASQVELGQALAIERAHLVGLLDHLEARGLVVRTPDPADRRRHAVALTVAGRALVEELGVVAARVEGDLLAALAPGEREPFREVLRRLAREAREE